jgi:hypothetical protein
VLALREEIEAAGHHISLGDPASIRLYDSETNQLGLDLWLWREEGELLVPVGDDPLVVWPVVARTRRASLDDALRRWLARAGLPLDPAERAGGVKRAGWRSQTRRSSGRSARSRGRSG